MMNYEEQLKFQAETLSKANVRHLFSAPFSTQLILGTSRFIQYEDNMILYYLFPLIERLCIELLNAEHGTNIEISTQGRYRTLFEILTIDHNKRKLRSTLGDHDFDYLKKLYKNDGIRNKAMKDFKYLKNRISILEVKVLALRLLSIYLHMDEKQGSFKKIEP